MHLFTATDPRYFHHATALLASWSQFHPRHRMVVFGVGLEENQVKALRQFGATVLTEGPPALKDWGAYVVCQRFVVLRQALPLFGDEAAMLFDADTILRKSLKSISEQMSAADVGVRLRDEPDEERKIYGGVVAVRHTPGAEAFLAGYERQLAQRGHAWYADQWALYRAWQELSESTTTSFCHLDVSVMDRYLSRRARAWCPSRSWRKSARFQEESMRLQHLFAQAVALQEK